MLCFFLLLVAALVINCASSHEKQQPFNTDQNDNVLLNILKKYPQKFSKVLSDSTEYDMQIIYTQIDRDKNNKPSYHTFTYGLDKKKYFYPASLVKLPCSAMAMEKLNELNIKGLDKFSRMQTDSAWKCQKRILEDTTAENKIPSVANYIKRMMLVSDNDAYSRIYEFLGQQYINKRMHDMSYSNAYIIHRFDAECNNEANKYTNPVSFYDSEGKLLYSQPMQHNEEIYKHPLDSVKKGKAYLNGANKLVKQPKDFTYSNFLTLQEIDNILKAVIFPQSVPEKQRFHIKEEDRQFLLRYMSMYPRESDHPHYDMKKFEDSYKKYFMYATWHKKIEQDTMRIFNVVGQSYGYLADCAYIYDFKNNVEFMLTAVLYVNSDGIINDGKYDYANIGFPFLSDLGNVIHDYELSRRREFKPDLKEFRLKY